MEFDVLFGERRRVVAERYHLDLGVLAAHMRALVGRVVRGELVTAMRAEAQRRARQPRR